MNGAREFRIHTISIGKSDWLVTRFGMVPSSQCLGSRSTMGTTRLRGARSEAERASHLHAGGAQRPERTRQPDTGPAKGAGRDPQKGRPRTADRGWSVPL